MFLPVSHYAWKILAGIVRQRRQAGPLGRMTPATEAVGRIDADPGCSRDQMETDTKTAHAPTLGNDGIGNDIPRRREGVGSLALGSSGIVGDDLARR